LFLFFFRPTTVRFIHAFQVDHPRRIHVPFSYTTPLLVVLFYLLPSFFPSLPLNMRSLLTLFSLVASACAYKILTPGDSFGWTTVGPNNVTWQRVSTDQTTYTMVLVNQDTSILPSGQEILIATVDGSLDTINVPAPSGGFIVGTGYQVNFVNDSQHLSSILAQSSRFSITQSNTTTSSRATNPTNAVASVSNPSPTSSAGDLNPTDSASNTTTPSNNGADRIAVAGSTGLIFAALAAFFL
jgi:hypothetical protein